MERRDIIKVSPEASGCYTLSILSMMISVNKMFVILRTELRG
jgi:hypothetical protein